MEAALIAIIIVLILVGYALSSEGKRVSETSFMDNEITEITQTLKFGNNDQ